MVYVIPGYSTNTSIGGSFCFRTTSSSAFPSFAFPATVPSWPFLVWDGATISFGQVVVNGSALSNQILVNANTAGGNFSLSGPATALFPPVVVTIPLP